MIRPDVRALRGSQHAARLRAVPDGAVRILGRLCGTVREHSIHREITTRRLGRARLEKRLAGLSAEQIRQYLEQLTAGRSAGKRKQRRKR